MSAGSGRRVRQLWWAWALLGVIAVALVVARADTRPTEGQSSERLFAIGSELKCQTCVGESVADSQAPSAVQFREEIAEQMARGGTDDEILNFFVQRYGQEVLLRPPGTGVGSVVWVLPVVGVAGGLVLLVLAYRRRRTEAAPRSATAEDAERVAAALDARRT